MQGKIAILLDKAFEASRIITRQRKNLSADDLKFLTDNQRKKVDNAYVLNKNYYFAIRQQIDKNNQDNLLDATQTKAFITLVNALKNPVERDKVKNKKVVGKITFDEIAWDQLFANSSIKDISVAALGKCKGASGKKKPQQRPLHGNIQNLFGYYMTLASEAKVRFSTEGFNNYILTDFGIAYFCSMFIMGSYSKKLLESTRFFSNFTGPEPDPKNIQQHNEWELRNTQLDYVREMISIYRIRTPRGRKLDCQSPDMMLAFDMLGELQKCPSELYDVLSPEACRTFDFKSNSDNDYAPLFNTHKRYVDRFAHLALRFIDECPRGEKNDVHGLFNDIRFQVRLGQFRFRFYDKTLIDGDPIVRRLQKDVSGYGRLQDVEKLRKDQYAELMQQSNYETVKLEHEDETLELLQFQKDLADSAPYITNRRAAYNIDANRIGLMWNREGDSHWLKGDDKHYLPKLTTHGESSLRKAPLEMPAPLCSLSTRELPALLFYEYLLANNKDNAAVAQMPNAESIIKSRYEGLRLFFENVSEGKFELECWKVGKTDESTINEELSKKYSGLTLKDVPQKLKDYVMGIEPKTTPLEHRFDYLMDPNEQHRYSLIGRRDHIVRRMETFETDRKNLGKKDNKYGKKSFSDVRDGALAKFLIDDIMSWLPGKKRHQPTGKEITPMNHRALLSFLATYGHTIKGKKSTPDDLKTIFSKANMLEGDMRHPFLSNVINGKDLKNRPVACGTPENIETLYLCYLAREKEYFDQLIVKFKNCKTAEDRKRVLNSVPFLYSNRLRYHERPSFSDGKASKAIMEQAKRYLYVEDIDQDNNPISHRASLQLPDGLFTAAIRELLNTVYKGADFLKEVNKSDENGNSDNNAAHLIGIYYTKVTKCKWQSFYNADRDANVKLYMRQYAIFSKLRNSKKGNSLLPLYLSPYMITERCREKDATGKNKKIMNDIAAYARSHKDKNMDELSLINQLKNDLSDCRNNERAIRRYQTQDVLLLYMARHILARVVQDSKVKDLSLDKLSDFMRKTVRCEIEVSLSKDQNGNSRKLKIVHPSMAIANHGEFFSLLNDQRFIDLLCHIEELSELDYTKIKNELSTYDDRRSSFFELFHNIERFVINHSNVTLIEGDAHYKASDGSEKVASLIKFADLLELAYTILGDEKKVNDDSLRLTRNSFAHNSFNVPLEKWMKDGSEKWLGTEYKKAYIEWMKPTPAIGNKNDNNSPKSNPGHTPVSERLFRREEDLSNQITNNKSNDRS